MIPTEQAFGFHVEHADPTQTSQTNPSQTNTKEPAMITDPTPQATPHTDHAYSDPAYAARIVATHADPAAVAPVVYLLVERWDDGTTAKSVWTSAEAAHAAWAAEQADLWEGDESPIVPIDPEQRDMAWYGVDAERVVPGMAWADSEDDAGYMAWIERHGVRS